MSEWWGMRGEAGGRGSRKQNGLLGGNRRCRLVRSEIAFSDAQRSSWSLVSKETAAVERKSLTRQEWLSLSRRKVSCAHAS